MNKLIQQLNQEYESQDDEYTDSSLHSSYDGCDDYQEEDYIPESRILCECIGKDKQKMSMLIIEYFINETTQEEKNELIDEIIQVKDKEEFINTEQDDSFILIINE